jgi:hypothetical protein
MREENFEKCAMKDFYFTSFFVNLSLSQLIRHVIKKQRRRGCPGRYTLFCIIFVSCLKNVFFFFNTAPTKEEEKEDL